MGDRTIWKFPIDIDDSVILKMPRGSEIIQVGEQFGGLCLWAIVDPDADLVDRHIFIRGTGHPMRNNVLWEHLGTVQMGELAVVWHVFEPVAH